MIRWSLALSTLLVLLAAIPGCEVEEPAPFEHIALLGAHADATCSDCHGTDLTAPVPLTCEGCHADDAPSPHFEGTCKDCHGNRQWEGAVFDHRPYFPLPHEGHGACTSCHLEATYATFSCTDCHTHRQSRMDGEHDDERGYVYESAACLDCHPDGDD